MSWNVKLSEVTTQLETIPEGKYAFQLTGANWDERDPSRLNVRAVIVSEGPQAGRRVMFNFPDATQEKFKWVLTCLKRLESALGVEKDDDEDPAAYLNRAAGNRFMTNMQHRKYTPEGGTEIVRSEVNLFNFAPSA
jgi:hypothetical protein